MLIFEQQNVIEKEQVSNSEGKPNIEGRQEYFRFQEFTTHDWDDPIPLDASKIVNSTNLLDFEERG